MFTLKKKISKSTFSDKNIRQKELNCKQDVIRAGKFIHADTELKEVQ